MYLCLLGYCSAMVPQGALGYAVTGPLRKQQEQMDRNLSRGFELELCFAMLWSLAMWYSLLIIFSSVSGSNNDSGLSPSWSKSGNKMNFYGFQKVLRIFIFQLEIFHKQKVDISGTIHLKIIHPIVHILHNTLHWHMIY